MILADFTASDAAWITLAVFLVLVGLALAYALWRLGTTLKQVSVTVDHAEQEILPVVNKAGGTLDRVNNELDKVDVMTTSALDAVQAVDSIVRAVSNAVVTPVQKLAGLASGIRYGASSFASHRDFDEAVRAGKDAAARREADLVEDLGEAGWTKPSA